jgi:hypothetical protein
MSFILYKRFSGANNHNPINVQAAAKISFYFPINRSTAKAENILDFPVTPISVFHLSINI